MKTQAIHKQEERPQKKSTCQHLDLSLLVSRAVRKYSSAIETARSVVLQSAAREHPSSGPPAVTCSGRRSQCFGCSQGSGERKPGLSAPCSTLCSAARALTPV